MNSYAPKQNKHIRKACFKTRMCPYFVNVN